MKFSSDYESILLALSLLLSLCAYLLRRRVFITPKHGKKEDTKTSNGDEFIFQKLLKKKENIFRVSAVAWLLFSLYILITMYKSLDGPYHSEELLSDIVFLVFPLYFAYHEYISWKNKEDYAGLRFINGLFAISMILYLVVYSVPPLAGAVVYFSAYKAAALLTLLGYPSQASGVDLGGNDGLLRENELFISSEIFRKGQTDLIDVNLTCSAFPSLVIFLALVLLSRKEARTKAKALLVIPLIHLLNVLRVAALVYVLYTEMMSYLLAHDILSRGLSLLALFAIFAYFFKLLPDVHKDFLSALGINKRHKIKKEQGVK